MRKAVRNKKVNNPEKFIWMVLKRHFPFLREWVEDCAFRGDRSLIEDINQTGWVAYLDTNGEFKPCYNACQRKLYNLSKQLGFRRTHNNHWWRREVGGLDENQKNLLVNTMELKEENNER